MTLAEMRPGDTGVMLTVPKYLASLHLCPGGHVRLITANSELALIDAGGARLAISIALANQMILTTYHE